MTWFPNIDPVEGVQLTEDGRDIAPIFPEDRARWTVATVRAALWLFRASWRYDLRAGVEYLQKVLGHVPDIRVLQEVFRPPIARRVALQELLIRTEGETVFVRFKGPPGSNIDEEINVFEPPAVPTISPLSWELYGDHVSIRFDTLLNPDSATLPEQFRLEGTDITVTGVAISGTHMRLALSGTPYADVRLVYTPGEISSPYGAVAEPFVLLLSQAEEIPAVVGVLEQRTGTRNAGTMPATVPDFDFLFEDAGFSEGSPNAWVATIWPGQPIATQPSLADSEDSGSVAIATWRNGKRAATQSGGARLDVGDAPDFGDPSASTELTWLFALTIPSAGGTGIGPCSTQISAKNFPLYFKNNSPVIMGSQPSASNRDSALDLTPYYGLDAIITVRQSASGIRFSMWIDGVGEVVTTAAGEASSASQSGLAICGWFGGGGEFPLPIGMVGCFFSALSDAEQDDARDWAAQYFAIPGA